jgi:cbb3-type cytochrome oxidase subunit 3
MYWLAGAIILFIICIILVIFAPKGRNFFDYTTYPIIKLINTKNETIMGEINNISDWIAHYKAGNNNIQIHPIHLFGVNCNNSTPNISSYFGGLPNIKNLYIIRLGENLPINKHHEELYISGEILRCIIPIKTSKKSGVWVNGEIKHFEAHKPIIFDTRKYYTYFNDTNRKILAIVFDIKRRTKIHIPPPSEELEKYIALLMERNIKFAD